MLRYELGAQFASALLQNPTVVSGLKSLSDETHIRRVCESAVAMADAFMDQTTQIAETAEQEPEQEPVSTSLESLGLTPKVVSLLQGDGIDSVEKLKLAVESGRDLTEIKGIGDETFADIKASVSPAE